MNNVLGTNSNNSEDNRVLQSWLERTLEKVKSGDITVAQAIRELSILPYEEMDFAKIDHHRRIRVGFPEVILGQGKTTEQIISIAGRLISSSDKILITRVNEAVYKELITVIPDAFFHPASRAIIVNRDQNQVQVPGVTIVTGGTADIPVAEEAAVTAELIGNKVEKVFDVGVAGLHRLLAKLPEIRKASVLVVVAGMEGALPSVVGGLVSVPLIAVPTSIGYGANFEGLAPLLTMLNSCAPGVSVVNIDNGFGAGYIAGMINRNKWRETSGRD